ncbi:hypothetical protein XM38_012140 [Halomicronema hongdechloris C2206]|uniref:Recombinase family protein n=1 Tax=Halomicronema hongdechloris C2206 TaxID=1641165 RepID=A0A1Z3HJJ4_9CYAN|nr:hypothetical protein [Halomicronema hongdechloris]ASC70277.1 hypothetical protein XM38_012140 [Halomicronema hongdechloris C2206]
MAPSSRWISGVSHSGKTTRLTDTLSHYGEVMAPALDQGRTLLVFAANGDNRITLAQRLIQATQGRYPMQTTTPSGFLMEEVSLFWPLLVTQLELPTQFPLRLRPETEQDLAMALWQPQLQTGALQVEGWLPDQTVRRGLDFLQLAAAAAIAPEDIGPMLADGIPPGFAPPTVWQTLAQALITWRNWCLQRGLLTYGIIGELYWRYLLPHPDYIARLPQRFCGVLADDVDEYPAVASLWFETLLAQGIPGCFTWNPDGQVRLGVGADPERLQQLQTHCQQHESLPQPVPPTLAYDWGPTIVQWVMDPLALPVPPPAIQTLQVTSRGDLLRRTAETIVAAIQAGRVAPTEVAIIAPGLDAIARYTLADILVSRGIPVEPLNEQRPLAASPLVRALLTLLTFVYPGLGRLMPREAVAEMLVVLSQTPEAEVGQAWFDRVQIDPVRAELIVDHCFVPHPEQPQLLPVSHFPRWDRLGYRATQAYEALLSWLQDQQQQRQQRLIPSVVAFLDRAIQQFLWRGNALPYDQLAALRELMETAQHFWEVDEQLRRLDPTSRQPPQEAIARFIQLLQRDTVTANPFPADALGTGPQGVTLATVFQYRLQRLSHRWQFWLDAGSPRWLTGTDALFGYPLFLSTWSGRSWTAVDIEQAHEQRLERILRDLLSRASERVVLCHSDLAVSGQEQTGPLLGLVNTAQPWGDEADNLAHLST